MNVQYAQSYGGNPVPNYAPRNMSDGGGGIQGPPNRRNLPRYYSRKSEKDGGGPCSCGCFCWCCCCVLIIIFILAGILVYAVVSLDPKPPVYRFNHLQVRQFDLSPDMSLHTEIDITVEAENPNRNIGISYGKESLVAVVYKGAMLCSGNLPSFYQDRQNTTVFDAKLQGNSTFGSGLHSALVENQQAQNIPLDIYVKVPVILRAWTTDTRELTVFVNCNVVVDSLTPNKTVSIKSATYKYNVKF